MKPIRRVTGPLTAFGLVMLGCGTEAVTSPETVLLFQKPPCAGNGGCSGGGGEPGGNTATVELAGGMVTDVPATGLKVEADNKRKLNVNHEVTSTNVLTGTMSHFTAGSCIETRAAEADPSITAARMAAELTDGSQTRSFAFSLNVKTGEGGINTTYDDESGDLGRVRLRVGESSSYPQFGVTSWELLSDDGTTRVFRGTGGRVLVWINWLSQDEIKLVCPNGDAIEVTVTLE